MGAATAGTILVVEDESTVRQLIRTILSRAGFEVIEASSGREAEALLQLHRAPFQLIIIDMVMPDGNGLDFANHLERERPGSNILYISGYAESVAVDAIVRFKPERMLGKPFTHEEILERVRMLCAKPGTVRQ
jgi:two-component system cell cycle sensor histidine kinase/response regulator CckA